MLKMFLVLLLSVYMQSSLAQVVDYARDGFPPLQPNTPAYNVQRRSPKLANLNKLEKKIFDRTYEDELDENRVARLEEQIFGTIQSGDLFHRYSVLQKAVPKYGKRTYTTTSFAPYGGMPVTSCGGWRGLAGSLGNFFNGGYAGYPTGFSPQITSPYINDYGPDYQRGYYTNHGWGINNSNYGAGSRVHILD